MQGLLIMDEDRNSGKRMADMFIEEGYSVTVPNTLANALCSILKKTAQVVLVGTRFDELTAADVIPLLKKCNKKLSIILVAADASMSLIRNLRKEGIFYHALKPQRLEDRVEICQAVRCAFENVARTGSND